MALGVKVSIYNNPIGKARFIDRIFGVNRSQNGSNKSPDTFMCRI